MPWSGRTYTRGTYSKNPDKSGQMFVVTPVNTSPPAQLPPEEENKGKQGYASGEIKPTTPNNLSKSKYSQGTNKPGTAASTLALIKAEVEKKSLTRKQAENIVRSQTPTSEIQKSGTLISAGQSRSGISTATSRFRVRNVPEKKKFDFNEAYADQQEKLKTGQLSFPIGGGAYYAPKSDSPFYGRKNFVPESQSERDAYNLVQLKERAFSGPGFDRLNSFSERFNDKLFPDSTYARSRSGEWQRSFGRESVSGALSFGITAPRTALVGGMTAAGYGSALVRGGDSRKDALEGMGIAGRKTVEEFDIRKPSGAVNWATVGVGTVMAGAEIRSVREAKTNFNIKQSMESPKVVEVVETSPGVFSQKTGWTDIKLAAESARTSGNPFDFYAYKGRRQTKASMRANTRGERKFNSPFNNVKEEKIIQYEQGQPPKYGKRFSQNFRGGGKLTAELYAQPVGKQVKVTSPVADTSWNLIANNNRDLLVYNERNIRPGVNEWQIGNNPKLKGFNVKNRDSFFPQPDSIKIEQKYLEGGAKFKRTNIISDRGITTADDWLMGSARKKGRNRLSSQFGVSKGGIKETFDIVAYDKNYARSSQLTKDPKIVILNDKSPSGFVPRSPVVRNPDFNSVVLKNPDVKVANVEPARVVSPGGGERLFGGFRPGMRERLFSKFKMMQDKRKSELDSFKSRLPVPTKYGVDMAKDLTPVFSGGKSQGDVVVSGGGRYGRDAGDIFTDFGTFFKKKGLDKSTPFENLKSLGSSEGGLAGNSMSSFGERLSGKKRGTKSFSFSEEEVGRGSRVGERLLGDEKTVFGGKEDFAFKNENALGFRLNERLLSGQKSRVGVKSELLFDSAVKAGLVQDTVIKSSLAKKSVLASDFSFSSSNSRVGRNTIPRIPSSNDPFSGFKSDVFREPSGRNRSPPPEEPPSGKPPFIPILPFNMKFYDGAGKRKGSGKSRGREYSYVKSFAAGVLGGNAFKKIGVRRGNIFSGLEVRI